jgi:DNA polymerase I-like protein with 3'-5' exonuclease and polymerase domains
MKIDYSFDIETMMPYTNGIRVCGLYQTGRPFCTAYNAGGLTAMLLSTESNTTIATWNGQRFDWKVLKELYKIDMDGFLLKSNIQHIDGMLLAKMVLPELPSYSLANVAKHLFPHHPEYHKDVVPKDEEGKRKFYNETPMSELTDYLKQDLITTLAVTQKLVDIAEERIPFAHWLHPLKVEQAVAEIIQRQVDTGVRFDYNKALAVCDALITTKLSMEAMLEALLPVAPVPSLDYPPKKQFKLNGEPTVSITNYCAKYNFAIVNFSGVWYAVNGSEQRVLPLINPLVTDSKLRPAEQGRIKEYLLSQGWVPTQWNQTKDKDGKWKKTSPRLTDRTTKEPCPNLLKMGVGWVNLLADWLQVRAKLSILEGESGKTGWIPTCEITDDLYHVLRSDADTCGTPTARFKHRNIVNVPRVTSFMGKEFRGLFIPRDGMKIVGWDADALEARMEAHYVHPFDPDYAKTLIEGDSKLGTDIHTLNWKRLGLRNRDDAKTFKYAITYGARPPKLAESLNVALYAAEDWYDKFWDNNTGLSDLINELEEEWRGLGKKCLVGLDGRLLTTRKPHALLNTKLQGGGSILMKHAMIMADRRITKLYGSEKAHGLIRMHDEEQWECAEEIADEVGRIGCESVVAAGEYLKLNVPMSATYKIGNSWADTH